MKYLITILETVSQVFFVEADNEKDAYEIADYGYYAGEIPPPDEQVNGGIDIYVEPAYNATDEDFDFYYRTIEEIKDKRMGVG